MLLGASCVQVCTAVMHYGFRIIDPLIDGLKGWMRQKGFARLGDFVGRSTQRIVEWSDLDLNYKIVAEIDQDKCINCGLCYIACEDGCHQSIRRERVEEGEFVRRMEMMHEGTKARRHEGKRDVATRRRGDEGTVLAEMGNGGRTFVSGGERYLFGAGDGYVNVYTINQDTCVGCNMCSLVCPVYGCITMKDVDTGKPSMTWREYQALLAAGKVEKIQPPDHV